MGNAMKEEQMSQNVCPDADTDETVSDFTPSEFYKLSV